MTTGPAPLKELPIACTLDAAGLRRRQSELRALAARMAERRVQDSAFLARFDAGDVSPGELAGLIARERECCRFLRFQLTAEEDSGPIWLAVTGPSGTGRFIERLFG